jgi:hypothetical protein
MTKEGAETAAAGMAVDRLFERVLKDYEACG